MITIVLPWPNAKLNPNQSKGLHWGATSAMRKKARADAHVLALQAARGRSVADGDIAMTITFFQPDKRARDRDNLLSASKLALDGIADALKVNDSRFNPVTIKRDYGMKPGYVLVEIAC